MNIRIKPIVAVASGTVLLSSFLCQNSQAQGSFYETGTSTLADVFGTTTGNDVLTVSWFVAESPDGLYTYGFNVNNPAGDVELNNNGTPTTTPETFNNFSITFNTTLPGAYVSGTEPVGGSLLNDGTSGLTWTFPAVSPGTSSPLLAFQSDLAPGINSGSMGNVGVGGGAIPPSPWSSALTGQTVPVPRVIPEPEITDMLALTALLLLPFSATWCRLVRNSWNSGS
jgi:hypothetical protein